MKEQPTSEQVVSALKMYIAFRKDRAKSLREQAVIAFHGNRMESAYRTLGQSDELVLVTNELDQLVTRIILGEV